VSCEVLSLQRSKVVSITFNCLQKLVNISLGLVLIEVGVLFVQMLLQYSVRLSYGLDRAIGFQCQVIKFIDPFLRIAKVGLNLFDDLHVFLCFIEIDLHFLDIDVFIVTLHTYLRRVLFCHL
jgi:hypothetical protein